MSHMPGFGGVYLNKAGSSREGSATFFRQSRFRLHSADGFPLRDLFAEVAQGGPALQRHQALLPQLQARGPVAEHLAQVPWKDCHC